MLKLLFLLEIGYIHSYKLQSTSLLKFPRRVLKCNVDYDKHI